MQCIELERGSFGIIVLVEVCLTALIIIHIEKPTTFEESVSTYVASRNFSDVESLPPRLRFTDSQLSELYPVRTKFNNSGVVFYNRVPKCGSTTMKWTLRRLRNELKFHLQNVDHHNLENKYGEGLEKFLATTVAKPKHDSLSVVQLPHVNFTRFGFDYPIYINVMRDPVERIVSKYYFARFGFKKRNGILNATRVVKIFTDEEKYMNINDCVLSEGKKCISDFLPSFVHFCGFDKKCGDRSQYAMQQSKLNVAKYYAVVGLLEDIPNTLKVLEAVLPRYFKNVEDIYFSSPEINGSQTYRKDPVTPEVRSRLRQMLPYEQEFYNFLKERFYQQLAMLKNEGRIL